MWSSKGHCGHQASLELANVVTNLLAHLAGKGQQLEPQAPLPPIDVLLVFSVFHCFFCKRLTLSRLEEMRDRRLSSWVQYVLSCSTLSLFSFALGPSFLSSSLPMATSDYHQTGAALQKHLNQLPNYILSIPYTTSLILYHSLWFHFSYWWLTDKELCPGNRDYTLIKE